MVVRCGPTGKLLKENKKKLSLMPRQKNDLEIKNDPR